MDERGLSEALLRLERMVVIATVVDLDTAAARARVRFSSEAISAWLPFSQLGSRDVRIWCPPVIGSQVLVLSPGGDTTRGVILPGPYDGAAPDADPTAFRLSMPGLDVRMVGGVASVTLTTAAISGTVTVDGDVLVTGDVVASGVSFVDHVHSGVDRGSGDTDPPS